jgi:hypothetical protein
MAKHPTPPPIFEIVSDADALPLSPADLDAAVADLLMPPHHPADPPCAPPSAPTSEPKTATRRTEK